MIEKLKDLIKIMNIYYQINKEVLYNYDVRNTNYNTLQNIKELNSNIELLTKIKETIKMKKLKDQFENALNIYDSINLKRMCISSIPFATSW